MKDSKIYPKDTYVGTHKLIYKCVKITTIKREDGKIKNYNCKDKRTCTIRVNIKILHRQHTSKEQNIDYDKISKLLI
jgi:hypothetical protein